MSRLLFLGPLPATAFTGGLQLALDTVTAQLLRRGWQVEASSFRIPEDSRSPVDVKTPLALIQRFPWLNRFRQSIPADVRLTISACFWSSTALETAAHNLRWIEQQLEVPSRYDVVLVCPEFCPRGALSLVLRRHPRVAVLSLTALADELKAFLWPLARIRRRHPDFFRPAKSSQIRCAIFASDHWRDETIHAGLSPSVAHTIYFGIPTMPAAPIPLRTGHRLLWVGRLAQEKGLHHLLDALPLLRHRFPDLSLTAVVGPGDPAYRAQIDNQIQTLHLQEMVQLHPSVPRDRLAEYYASHDLLFFHSMYAEPVALVLMEAYAAGIPVIANQVNHSDLVQNSHTCTTYQPHDPSSIATAIQRCFDQPELTHSLASNARSLVERKYSLDAMGDAYHRLLSAL